MAIKNNLLDKLPKHTQYTDPYKCSDCGKIKVTNYKNYEDDKVCPACKRRVNRPNKLDLSDFPSDVRRLIQQLGHQPNEDEYRKAGKYSLAIVTKTFKKSWSEILVTLGYKVPKPNKS